MGLVEAIGGSTWLRGSEQKRKGRPPAPLRRTCVPRVLRAPHQGLALPARGDFRLDPCSHPPHSRPPASPPISGPRGSHSPPGTPEALGPPTQDSSGAWCLVGGQAGLDAVKGPQASLPGARHELAESDTEEGQLDPHPRHLSRAGGPLPFGDRGCGTAAVTLQAENDHLCGGCWPRNLLPSWGGCVTPSQ